jgi:hypothetical protein
MPIDPRIAPLMQGSNVGQVVDPSYASGRAMQDWLSNPYNLQMLAGVFGNAASVPTGGMDAPRQPNGIEVSELPAPQAQPQQQQAQPSAPMPQRKPEYDGSTQDAIDREVAQQQGGQSNSAVPEPSQPVAVGTNRGVTNDSTEAASGGPGWLDAILGAVATGAVATMPKGNAPGTSNSPQLPQQAQQALPAPTQYADFTEVNEPALPKPNRGLPAPSNAINAESNEGAPRINKPNAQLEDLKTREQSGPTIKAQDGTAKEGGKAIRGAPAFNREEATAFSHGGRTYYVMPGSQQVYNEGGTHLGDIRKIAPNKANMIASLAKRVVR